MNIAELLFDQRADPVMVAVVPAIVRQVLSAHDLWFMGAALVALVGDAIV